MKTNTILLLAGGAAVAFFLSSRGKSFNVGDQFVSNVNHQPRFHTIVSKNKVNGEWEYGLKEENRAGETGEVILPVSHEELKLKLEMGMLKQNARSVTSS